MLFNIMADMLAILIVRREGGGHWSGRWSSPTPCRKGVSILQYDDDTILCMEYMYKDVNMELIFCIFKKPSDLKINFHREVI